MPASLFIGRKDAALCVVDLHALCLSDTISLFGNVDERGFQQFCIGENACLLLCVPQVLRGSGSPCHTSKFGPQNRLRCRSSIMTHRVEESETSHSISAVFPTGEPSPRKYRSEADWPGVEPRNTAWQRPREKLRRFHEYDLPEGSSLFPVEAQRTGYGGTWPGNVPHRSVRKTSVCGVIPLSSSQRKQGLKSVPPPPMAVSFMGWPAWQVSTFCTSVSKYRTWTSRGC